MNKYELAYAIWKEQYEYKEFDMASGIVLFKETENGIFICEMQSKNDGKFLIELFENVHRYLDIQSKKKVEAYIDQIKLGKWLSYMIKHGAQIKSVNDNYVHIEITKE